MAALLLTLHVRESAKRGATIDGPRTWLVGTASRAARLQRAGNGSRSPDRSDECTPRAEPSPRQRSRSSAEGAVHAPSGALSWLVSSLVEQTNELSDELTARP
eukprot:CAMPEP_0183368588 /NCGR_PEP_ID=MMETSP0164_2-20130417/96541_1 /TAXON_ID=221442 /ORGANISM="Coccolithus pelagicus ssp braarudi, Strain PLY182g" /LENGTH=102 /DNA_ID=CAMNT_0025544709 /DNA_START=208 /DNA_END=513 /DNA_ORIENTATION=+